MFPNLQAVLTSRFIMG